MNIGILNLQGAVSEHYNITKKAIKNMGIDADVKTVRYAENIACPTRPGCGSSSRAPAEGDGHR